MHDINRIRRDPKGFDAALARRGVQTPSADLLARDAARREAIAEAQELQTKLPRRERTASGLRTAAMCKTLHLAQNL